MKVIERAKSVYRRYYQSISKTKPCDKAGDYKNFTRNVTQSRFIIHYGFVKFELS